MRAAQCCVCSLWRMARTNLPQRGDRMNWRIGPWRENFILKERLAHHERWLEQAKANADFWKAEWGQMYRALMASQKGCVRLRRRLNKLLQRNNEAT